MPLLPAALSPCLHPPPSRLEAEQGIVARFVIGHSADTAAEAALAAEEAAHHDFQRLPLTEGYAGLPAKTLLFLRVGLPTGAAERSKAGRGCCVCRFAHGQDLSGLRGGRSG